MNSLKLPPLPDNLTYADTGPIWPLILEWELSAPGPRSEEVAHKIDAALKKLLHDYAFETVRLNL